ncbi:MAG: hypothetical protein PHY08_13640, partial [Candidatus Cloacimonetes bacterium]|nr:hypothetical protein [Candidatus Cloacimonadota bacterium]
LILYYSLYEISNEKVKQYCSKRFIKIIKNKNEAIFNIALAAYYKVFDNNNKNCLKYIKAAKKIMKVEIESGANQFIYSIISDLEKTVIISNNK